jgi:hypothetical protein
MIAIVQIGDIHIRINRVNPVLNNATLIVAALRTFVAPCSELYLVLSGDISYAGKETEYELAAAFLGELEDGLKKLNGPRFVGTVAVPGNHDCDFDEAGDLRETAITGVASKLHSLEVDGKTASELLRLQERFFDFLALLGVEAGNKQRLYWESAFPEARYKVIFRCLNTAWVSRRDEKPGQIFFPHQLVRSVDAKSDLVVTLLHHPYGWLEPNNARALKRCIETSSDLILTGHEHESDTYRKTLSDGTTMNYVEGAALFDQTVRENGFNVILLDSAKTTYQVAQFWWQSTLYEQQPITTGIFARNQKLLEHQFQNNDEYRAFLDDIGTPFTHNEKTDLKLSDLFVYPDLRVSGFKTAQSTKRLCAAQRYFSML